MVSMRLTVMTVTLVALCVLATNTHAAYISCCRRYIPVKIPFSEIIGFSQQRWTEFCPATAIIFHTKKGKRCADPTEKWVMDYVSHIENLAKKMSVSDQKRTRASDNFNLRGSSSSVAPKDHQKPKPRPKQSFTAAPDKIITDGPPPVKLCKW